MERDDAQLRFHREWTWSQEMKLSAQASELKLSLRRLGAWEPGFHTLAQAVLGSEPWQERRRKSHWLGFKSSLLPGKHRPGEEP